MPAGTPLSDQIRKKLTALVVTHGPTDACELLGLPIQTVARAAAGWGVRAGTAMQIAHALERLHDGEKKGAA